MEAETALEVSSRPSPRAEAIELTVSLFARHFISISGIFMIASSFGLMTSLSIPLRLNFGIE